MSRLTVPDSAYPFLKLLYSRSSDALIELTSALISVEIEFSRSTIQEALVVKNIMSTSDADLFINELQSIYISKHRLSLSGSEWYADFLSALEDDAPVEWKEENLTALKEKQTEIVQLLSLQNFDIITKAKHLTVEHERILLHSRIITDIRPVFRDTSEIDNSEDMIIDASVVTSVLKLEYRDRDHGRKEFFVHLDLEDLARLRSQCDRALAKVRTITDQLASLDWKIYSPGSTYDHDEGAESTIESH